MKLACSILVLWSIALYSCEKIEALFDEVSLHISIPQNVSDYTWGGYTTRALFFIRNNAIETRKFNSTDTTVEILVEKIQNIPVLSCILFNTSKISIHDCNFPLGGIYPFDVQNNTLLLKPLHHADIAQLLLTLYQQNSSIHTINIHKLYTTINKKISNTPMDTNRFFEYITQNKLSYWGIISREALEVALPTTTKEWISCNDWIVHISPSTETLTLYQGKWRFVQKHNSDAQAIIYVDNNRRVTFSGFN